MTDGGIGLRTVLLRQSHFRRGIRIKKKEAKASLDEVTPAGNTNNGAEPIGGSCRRIE